MLDYGAVNAERKEHEKKYNCPQRCEGHDTYCLRIGDEYELRSIVRNVFYLFALPLRHIAQR